jgi:hypothetical protein
MPLTHFLGLVTLVLFAAATTIALAVWSGVPLIALGFAAAAGSVILTWARLSR